MATDDDLRLASRRPITPDRPLPRTLNPFDLRFDVRRRSAERSLNDRVKPPE
ncbi:hypothetical protein NE235_21965 [Actinoallomurus spadix]|uniref:Uncharacterized protein n=1 Tax=Actinoallomurus spadix TaxID=79912 RepID=A0ABN0XDX6_9ACTN|nr:hypothetical protein [Actinoallomurus spadix]MCO5988775.1 hypothetical protein [Actinoallomurus spadix]